MDKPISAAAIVDRLDAEYQASVANLRGGILAWARDVDPALATY